MNTDIYIWNDNDRIAFYSDQVHSIDEIQTLTERIIANPSDIEALVTRAMLYLNFACFNQALKDIDIAMDIDSIDYNVLYLRGMILFALEDYEEAINFYSLALMETPDSIFALCNRASAYFEDNRLLLALADINTSLIFKPDNGIAYWIKGQIHEALNEIENARTSYQKAHELGFQRADECVDRLNAKGE